MRSIDRISSAVGCARRSGARALFGSANCILRRSVNLYERHMIASVVLRAALAAVRFLERSAACLVFGRRPHDKGPR
jgi:hypothetical protein